MSMPFKKNLTKLTPKGSIDKSHNKNASQKAMSPMRNTNPGSATLNDYAKSTPMAQPSEATPGIPDMT